MHFVVGAIIHTMAQEEVLQRISQGSCGQPTIDITLNRFFSFAISGLRNGQSGEPAAVESPQATFDF